MSATASINTQNHSQWKHAEGKKKINLNKHTDVILIQYGANQLQGNILSTQEEYVFVNDQLIHTLHYSFYVAQTH